MVESVLDTTSCYSSWLLQLLPPPFPRPAPRPYGENFAQLHAWTMTLWTCSRSSKSTTLWTRLIFTRLVKSGLRSTTKKLLPLYFAHMGAGTDWRPSIGPSHGPPWWVNALAECGEFILFSLGISREKCPLPRGVVEGRKRGREHGGGREGMGQGMAVE